MEWLETCAPYISHFHVHNNDGTQDQHNALNDGRIPMKEFLKEDPGVQIVLENVLETEPQWLLDIIKGEDDERLKMCLDIGHVNAYSEISVMEWLETCAPYISHFHVHNNDGTRDQHNALNDGKIPMMEFLLRAEALCPDATFTFELMKDEPSMAWLKENGLV